MAALQSKNCCSLHLLPSIVALEKIGGRGGIHNILLLKVSVRSNTHRSFANVCSCVQPLKVKGLLSEGADNIPGVNSSRSYSISSGTGTSLLLLLPLLLLVTGFYGSNSSGRDFLNIKLCFSSQTWTFYLLCAGCVVVALQPAHADSSHQLTAFQAIFSLQIKSNMLFFNMLFVSAAVKPQKTHYGKLFSVFINTNLFF